MGCAAPRQSGIPGRSCEEKKICCNVLDAFLFGICLFSYCFLYLPEGRKKHRVLPFHVPPHYRDFLKVLVNLPAEYLSKQLLKKCNEIMNYLNRSQCRHSQQQDGQGQPPPDFFWPGLNAIAFAVCERHFRLVSWIMEKSCFWARSFGYCLLFKVVEAIYQARFISRSLEIRIWSNGKHNA